MISRSGPKKQIYPWLGLYVFSALFFFLLISYTTPYGVGTSPDSFIYIQTAQNLVNGKGLAYHDEAGELVPLTHYPPLYPVVLAAGSGGAVDIQGSVRLINALALAGLLSVSALLLRSYTNSTFWVTLSVLAIVGSMPVIYSYWMAWSEPLFLFLTVLTFFLLTKAADERGYTPWLLAGVTAGLAGLTRYAGVALVVTGGIFILFLHQATIKKRILRLGAFVAVSTFPLALWLLVNLQKAGTSTNRSLAWHPVTLQRLADGATSAGAWLIPGGISSPWIGVALAGLTMLLVVLARPLERRLKNFLALAGLFAVVYAAFLLASISLVDAYTPLDRRILAPLNVTWLFSVILLARTLTERRAALGQLRWLPLGLLLITSTLNLAASGAVVFRSATSGTGYSTRTLSASPLWSYLASLPAGVVLFSNAADVIYVHTERTVPYVPRKYEMVSLRPNPEYEEEMRAMARRVQEGAVVVYFPDVRRHFIPDVQEFESLTGLKARPIGDNAVVFTNTKIGDHP